MNGLLLSNQRAEDPKAPRAKTIFPLYYCDGVDFVREAKALSSGQKEKARSVLSEPMAKAIYLYQVTSNYNDEWRLVVSVNDSG